VELGLFTNKEQSEMSTQAHPAVLAELLESLNACSVEFERLSLGEMDTPGFVDCCEQFENLAQFAMRTGKLPADIADALHAALLGEQMPSMFFLGSKIRYRTIEHFVGYWRWSKVRIDEDDKFSPFIRVLEPGSISKTSLGSLFLPICESGEGDGFDEDAEDLRAWPEVCRRYSFAVKLLGRSIENGDTGTLQPSSFFRSSGILGVKREGITDATEPVKDKLEGFQVVDHEDDGGNSLPAPIKYFEEKVVMHRNLVYLLFRCGICGEKIDTAEKRMLKKFKKEKPRYHLAKKAADRLTWEAGAGSDFSKLMRNRKIRVSIDGGHDWVLHPAVHSRVQMIAEEQGWKKIEEE
jgi:hypothetical protein